MSKKTGKNELKKDYLTGHWVCFAESRATRPQNFKEAEISEDSKIDCPFCPENENLTPSKVFESADKRVKIVPNKYPALSEISINGFGFHDVLIDTPIHEERLWDFSSDEMLVVLESIKKRLLVLKENFKIKYIQVFKNEGSKAGASLYHSHWQIIAMPIIPSRQKSIRKNFLKYKEKNNSCYLCDSMSTEEIVFENKEFLTYMPSAALYTYGVNITAKKHISRFTDFNSEELFSLAETLRVILKAYKKLFGNFSYNICFQDSPVMDSDLHHFFLQIIPRISGIAGFEFSTGCYINSVSPEVGAENLRRALFDEN